MLVPALPTIDKPAATVTLLTVGGCLWLSTAHYLAFCAVMGLAVAVEGYRQGLNPALVFVANALLAPLTFYRAMASLMASSSVLRRVWSGRRRASRTAP